MEKFNTGGLRRHEIIYSLDTGRLMGGPFPPLFPWSEADPLPPWEWRHRQ
jgi:hypothetical protein